MFGKICKIIIRDLTFVICFSSVIAVIMDPKSRHDYVNDDDTKNFHDTLSSCLAERNHGTFECVNKGTLSVLRNLNNEDVLDYDEIKLERAEGQSRDLLDLDYDPKDFGNVVRAAARLMEQRNFRWDLSNVYPGLQMRVGPMLNGNGILEFVVDDRINGYSDRQLGTGRMLMRSLLLPLLLGFKFSLSSLIPLIFGIVLLVTKKALILTKVALLLSGLLGLRSIFNGGQGHPGGFSGSLASSFSHGGHGPYNSHGYDGFNGLVGSPYHGLQYPYRSYEESSESPSSNSPIYGQHVVREIVNVYDDDEKITGDDSSRIGKNFVWNTSA